MPKLQIAILSMCALPGDVAGNLRQLEGFARRAGAYGCHALLTPELSVSGYGGYPEVLACREEAGKGPIYRGLARIARETGVVLLAGFPEADGERTYIAHYAVYPDGRYAAQRKHRATPAEAPFAPWGALYDDGTEELGQLDAEDARFTLFELEGVRCAIVICADAGIRGLHDRLDRLGVELVFLPVGAGGTRAGRITTQELRTPEGIERYCKLLNSPYFFPGDNIRACLRHRRAIAVVNMCGFDGKERCHGGSGSIVNRYGEITAQLVGLENVDRQRPLMAFGEVETEEENP